MIKYELAKKLKAAGFFQKKVAGAPFYYEATGLLWADIRSASSLLLSRGINMPHDDRLVFIPTLSELIEACGEKFEQLRRCPEVDTFLWWAYEVYKPNGIACGEGHTPEEAVANLYLAINEKKNV